MENKLATLLKKDLITCPQKKIGLFTGKMGVCLSLYITNEKYKDKEVDKLAEKLLNDVITDLPTETRLTVDHGLIGIGLAINTLLECGFVEGCADDVLYNIDATLYKKVKDSRVKHSVDCCTGLIGYLIYIVNRLQNHRKNRPNTKLYELNSATLRTIIDSLAEAMPATFDQISKDLYISILWNFPLLFIHLKQALALNLYNRRIINILRDWTFYISAYNPTYNINKLYLAVSLEYLNQTINNLKIEKQIKNLLFALDFDELYNEIDPKVMNVNEGWFFPAMIVKVAEELFQESTYKKSFRSLRLRIDKTFPLLYKDFIEQGQSRRGHLNASFIHGLAGVEMVNSLRNYLFK